MRSYVPAYELKVALNLQEALTWLAEKPGVWKPFAGGTDLMVLFEAGKLEHKKFLSIWNLEELRGIKETGSFLQIGALITYTDLLRSDLIQREFPMLGQASRLTGAVAIQNRGTLGGNIVNASPAADSPPALLAYDAEVELVSKRGSRWVRYSHFHTGYKTMRMEPDELLKNIRLPRNTKGMKHYYRKVGTRKAQAISKVCFAGVLRKEGERIKEVRIGLGSVAPVPLRCFQTESSLQGQILTAPLVQKAQEVLATEIAPIDDLRSDASYRLRVAQNLLQDFLYVGLD